MAKVTGNARIKRGRQSWDFLYTMLGFALTIETGIVALTPLKWPLNLIFFLVVGAGTVWFFLRGGWFHNKLLALRGRYEGRE
ncbi:MAG: hypothetical protein ACR2JJ_08340 [Sphingomicrobium sp.]